MVKGRNSTCGRSERQPMHTAQLHYSAGRQTMHTTQLHYSAMQQAGDPNPDKQTESHFYTHLYVFDGRHD